MWRFAFRRLSCLCFDIFARRFFLMEPTVVLLDVCLRKASHVRRLENDLVERELDDALGPGGAEQWDEVADLRLLDYGFDGVPAL